MLIRYGYEITLTCQQPTALVCLLSVHDDRAADIRVPATIRIEVPGNSRLKNANDSPNAVTNITGKAQLECAETKSSVGWTRFSMVLYIGDLARDTRSFARRGFAAFRS